MQELIILREYIKATITKIDRTNAVAPTTFNTGYVKALEDLDLYIRHELDDYMNELLGEIE